MITVAHMFRHPIKSHGREAIENVTLVAGQAMPWDRHWAVTHDASKFDKNKPAWTPCANFMLGARTPGLAGIWAKLDTRTRRVTLTHRDLFPLEFAPDTAEGVQQFLAWVAPLCPANRAGPTDIVTVPGRAMTDSPLATVSIMNLASHRAVETALNTPLELERWRANIWLDGLEPWAEHDMVGETLQIGACTLKIIERIPRCSHTAAHPVTGTRDIDIVAGMTRHFDHSDFGMQAEVITGGPLHIGDKAQIL